MVGMATLMMLLSSSVINVARATAMSVHRRFGARWATPGASGTRDWAVLITAHLPGRRVLRADWVLYMSVVHVLRTCTVHS